MSECIVGQVGDREWRCHAHERDAEECDRDGGAAFAPTDAYATATLDVAYDDASELEAFVADGEARDVELVRVVERGPAGGWPVYEARAQRPTLEAFVRAHGYEPADVIA